MLVELSVVERKYQAVLAVIGDGREVTDVARQFGVSLVLRRIEHSPTPQWAVDRRFKPDLPHHGFWLSEIPRQDLPTGAR
jgi:hypothetical protein